MSELGNFYLPAGRNATHLALTWKGGVRYIVPRDRRMQNACWDLFQPGHLKQVLRLKAAFPGIAKSITCCESEDLVWIRSHLPMDAGPSCVRRGASGPWSKDTILFLNPQDASPQSVVKAGMGAAVMQLLATEANWLRSLAQEPLLANHVPRLLGEAQHKTGVGFLAQQVMGGDAHLELGLPHFQFLNALHTTSRQLRRYGESGFAITMSARFSEVGELLPQEWNERLRRGMSTVERAFGTAPFPFVTGHNDFTSWNVRVSEGNAKVFDWEYAEPESLPLLDALHFALKPLALRVASAQEIEAKAAETIALCRDTFDAGRCEKPEAQLLAYYVSLCTLFVWADRGIKQMDPMLQAYAPLIDEMSA